MQKMCEINIQKVTLRVYRIEMIVSSVMGQLGKGDSRTATRIVVGLCLFCFLCGLPLTTRVQ